MGAGPSAADHSVGPQGPSSGPPDPSGPHTDRLTDRRRTTAIPSGAPQDQSLPGTASTLIDHSGQVHCLF